MFGRDFAAAVTSMVKLWKQTLSADERMTERSDAATSGSGMFTLRFIQCLPCSLPIVLVSWWVRRLHLVETDSWLHYGVFVIVQQRPPPPQYNLYAHTLGIIGLPVPPGGYLPGKMNFMRGCPSWQRRACPFRTFFKSYTVFCGSFFFRRSCGQNFLGPASSQRALADSRKLGKQIVLPKKELRLLTNLRILRPAHRESRKLD